MPENQSNIGHMAEWIRRHPEIASSDTPFTLGGVVGAYTEDLLNALGLDPHPDVSGKDFALAFYHAYMPGGNERISEKFASLHYDVLNASHDWDYEISDTFEDEFLEYLNTKDILSCYLSVTESDVILKGNYSEDNLVYSRGLIDCCKFSIHTAFTTFALLRYAGLSPSEFGMRDARLFPDRGYTAFSFLFNYSILYALNRIDWGHFTDDEIADIWAYVLDASCLFADTFDNVYFGDGIMLRELENCVHRITSRPISTKLAKELVQMHEGETERTFFYHREGPDIFRMKMDADVTNDMQQKGQNAIAAVNTMLDSAVAAVIGRMERDAKPGETRSRAKRAPRARRSRL